nr:uncharacterized protein LOC109730113 [Microcebus murinus]
MLEMPQDAQNIVRLAAMIIWCWQFTVFQALGFLGVQGRSSESRKFETESWQSSEIGKLRALDQPRSCRPSPAGLSASEAVAPESRLVPSEAPGAQAGLSPPRPPERRPACPLRGPQRAGGLLPRSPRSAGRLVPSEAPGAQAGLSPPRPPERRPACPLRGPRAPWPFSGTWRSLGIGTRALDAWGRPPARPGRARGAGSGLASGTAGPVPTRGAVLSSSGAGARGGRLHPAVGLRGGGNWKHRDAGGPRTKGVGAKGRHAHGQPPAPEHPRELRTLWSPHRSLQDDWRATVPLGQRAPFPSGAPRVANAQAAPWAEPNTASPAGRRPLVTLRNQVKRNIVLKGKRSQQKRGMGAEPALPVFPYKP